MEKQERDNLWSIVDRYLKDDPMHGLPHIRRVHGNFRLLPARLVPIEVRDALETAVVLHDIGRGISGQTNHAAKSAEELKKLFSGELSGIPNQEWILGAVASHSVGFGEGVKNRGDLILAFLCVFDHMDCLGSIGIHRLTLYWAGGQPYSKPWLPLGLDVLEKTMLVSRLSDYLQEPVRVTREMMAMRENSLLEALVYFCCATHHIVEPVREMIGGESLNREVEQRVSFMRNYIESLMHDLTV